ncbi:MAG: band 7 protein [Sphingobacteriales bacterium]|nr:band 7 protein [Sphingobacteriales bacterium]
MVLLYIIALTTLLGVSGLRRANENQRSVVFTLGKYTRLKGPGLFWIMPLIEHYQLVDIRVASVGLEPQELSTKDNVFIKINAVLWYKVLQPNEAIVNVGDYEQAICRLSSNTLQNIISKHTLKEILRDREMLNITLQKLTDVATEPWGIKIKMAEIKGLDTSGGFQNEKFIIRKPRLNLN